MTGSVSSVTSCLKLRDSNEWKNHISALRMVSICRTLVDVFSRASLPADEDRAVLLLMNLKKRRRLLSHGNPHSWARPLKFHLTSPRLLHWPRRRNGSRITTSRVRRPAASIPYSNKEQRLRPPPRPSTKPLDPQPKMKRTLHVAALLPLLALGQHQSLTPAQQSLPWTAIWSNPRTTVFQVDQSVNSPSPPINPRPPLPISQTSRGTRAKETAKQSLIATSR